MSVTLLAAAAVARAEEPPPDSLCDEAVSAWAKSASQRAGREIKPIACPSGLVRLQVASAGCDYEVTRGAGFQRTADNAFAVSPIVNIDWRTAPEPMKSGLTTILSALAQDPSLPVPTGGSVRRPPEQANRAAGALRPQVFAGAALAALAASALAFWWKRRKAPPARAEP